MKNQLFYFYLFVILFSCACERAGRLFSIKYIIFIALFYIILLFVFKFNALRKKKKKKQFLMIRSNSSLRNKNNIFKSMLNIIISK